MNARALGGKALGVLALAALAIWLFGSELFPGNGKLYDAIAAGDAAAARRLLTAGADPNSQAEGLTGQRSTVRRYSYPPLVYALRRNKPEIALALVEAGADPNAHDLEGASALWLARSQRMPEVVRALAARGAVCEAPGHRRCEAGPSS